MGCPLTPALSPSEGEREKLGTGFHIRTSNDWRLFGVLLRPFGLLPFGARVGWAEGFVGTDYCIRFGPCRAGTRRSASQSEALLHIVEQLADKDGGRRRAVVLHALANVADVKAVAGREQRFEKEIAVVLARRSVAKPRGLRHEVETELLGRPRKGAVVHPDEANHPERDAAHRLETAEGDAAGEESGLVEIFVERGTESFEQRGPADGAREPSVLLLASEGLKLAAEDLKLALRVVGNREETVERAVEKAGPFVEAAPIAERVDEFEDTLDVFGQAAGERGGIPLDVIQRENAVEEAQAASSHCVTKEQAVETGAPGLPGESGQPEPLPV